MASFHSKAQASLNKILHTISSVKPPQRFDIDLNLSLVDACWEFDGDGHGHGDGEYENGNLDACSFSGTQIESDSSGTNGEKRKEGSCSVITNLHNVVVEEETKEDIETEPLIEQNDNDCFGLLIAAAELISSNEAESSPSQDQDKDVTRDEKARELFLSAGESMRTRDLKSCTADVEDTSASASAPVVRSKRGRSQVLPCRYRDSVLLLEPSKRRREPKMKRRAR